MGNSLTRSIPLQRLRAFFAASGGRYIYGSQLGGGHRLSQHLVKRNHQNAPGKGAYNSVAPFGEYDCAFREHRFDAVILQPYMEELDRASVSTPAPPYFRAGDLQYASAFVD